MSKLHRIYVVLIVLLLMAPVTAIQCNQDRDTTMSGSFEKIYVIQIAASRVYIDPGYFREKLKLTEEVRYFTKGGWYKYIFGSWKTEQEATQILSRLKFDAFITWVIEKPVTGESRPAPDPKPTVSDSLLETRPSIADTLQPTIIDSLSMQVIESGLRGLYNQKIREADSSFNLAKDLLRARKMYGEALLMASNKNYPKDQIIEIDKQLSQKQSKSVLSKIPLRVFIITGIVFVLILLTVIILLLLSRRQSLVRQESEQESTLPPC